MKKKYMTPQLEVLIEDAYTPLLAGSPVGAGVKDEEADESDALAPDYDLEW